MKRILIILLTCMVLAVSAGCEIQPIKKDSKVAGVIDGLQISVNKDGSVNIQGQPDESFDFSEWDNIKSVSISYLNAAGVKNDGTVVVTGNNDLGTCDTEDWQDIVMAESTYFTTYGLQKDGTVIYTDTKDESENDILKAVDEWENISYIDAEEFGVVGIKGIGEVVVATWFDDELKEQVKEWKNVCSVSIYFDSIVGVTRSGKILAAFGTISKDFSNYTEPYKDLTGAVKVCLGDTFVAGLMQDGTVTVRSRYLDPNAIDEVLGVQKDNDITDSILKRFNFRTIDDLTKSERKAVHQYAIDHMPDDLNAIDDATNIIDINSYNDTLVALKSDGTILIAGTIEDDDD